MRSWPWAPYGNFPVNCKCLNKKYLKLKLFSSRSFIVFRVI
jgi:hypothetical protein